MDKLAFLIFNITINSFLAFITAALLIELLIWIFRLKSGRCTAYLRIIPIFKLALDPFLYDFSRWSYLQGINPLCCEEGTRMFTIGTSLFPGFEWLFVPILSDIHLSVYEKWTFTLADIAAYQLPSSWKMGITLMFISATSFVLIRQLVQLYRSIKQLKALKLVEKPFTKPICNSKLATYIDQHPSYRVVVSPTLESSPFATGFFRSVIFIPQHLADQLSQKEYEAVIAHELEHLSYKDHIIRMMLSLISTLFWWVPTKWLLNNIEQGLETACDLQCYKHDVHPIDLASAIYKCAKAMARTEAFLVASYLVKEHPICTRVGQLLAPISLRFQKTRTILAACAVCVAFTGILFGRYWIF